jgi:hypothetical protein
VPFISLQFTKSLLPLRPIALRFCMLVACAMSLGNHLQAQVVPQDTLAPQDSMPAGKNAVKATPPSGDNATLQLSNDGTAIAAAPADGDTAKIAPQPAKGSHAFQLHLSPKKDFYDPKVAVRRSAILPGWGQVYNNRLWKVPIVYGGFALFVSFIIGNNQGYREYDAAVKCKGDTNCIGGNNDLFPGLTIDNVISVREDYRRFRDLSAIMCGLWYMLNLVDAYVDAHLRGFNVSDDLTLDVNPKVGFDPFGRKSMFVGASLTFNLRR